MKTLKVVIDHKSVGRGVGEDALTNQSILCRLLYNFT